MKIIYGDNYEWKVGNIDRLLRINGVNLFKVGQNDFIYELFIFKYKCTILYLLSLYKKITKNKINKLKQTIFANK